MIFAGVDYSDLGLSPEKMQERLGKWFAWHSKMAEAGIVKDGHALTPEVTRISGPDKTVTDRVTVETKELVGGYYVIDAKDLDEAKKVAQDYPDYDLGGTVEVREVMIFES